jgi:flagellar biosynthesis protein
MSKDEQRRAAALRYDHGTSTAPLVVAKGNGAVAEQIVALARRHGIPIKEDRYLVAVHSTMNLYDEIPAELYKAVAEVLAFIYRISGRL